MTDRELKRLSRADLIEMLLALTRDNDQLREELAQAKQQLESRSIAIENSGSLAEAALQLNGVFEVAQAACEQYTRNVHQRSGQQQEICDQMEKETREKCERMLQQAKQEADAYWEYVREKVRGVYLEQNLNKQDDAR